VSGSRARAVPKSFTQLVCLLQPLPRVAPTRDSSVVRSLLAAGPVLLDDAAK
jgi:hypothetical protein